MDLLIPLSLISAKQSAPYCGQTKLLPLQNLTSFYIAKLIWNKSFKAERLHLSGLHHNRERIWEIQLTVYRDEAIRKVNIFVKEYSLSFPLKDILTESLFLLHEAYHQLILWKINYDKDDKIDIMQEGELYAPNFFSASGKFNDCLWTKRLIENENYSTAFRFSLATFYHFDLDICNLWDNLLTLEDIPPEDGFNIFGICKDFRKFKFLFAVLNRRFGLNEYLEREERSYSPNFFFSLVRNGCEYAIYARWKIMSNYQQLVTIMNDSYFEMINGGMDFPRCKISYFLYSRLSEDRRKDFFQWSLRHVRAPEMWLALLFTSSGGDLYDEILKCIFKLPISIFSILLLLLSHRIRQLRLPLDAQLFETLVKNTYLEKYFEILLKGKFIILNLVKAKSFHNIRCIIKRFSLEQKHKCLFNKLYGAGINILDALCTEGEFDLLQNYLSCFLNNVDSHTEMYNLRRKDILLLKKFRESSEFQKWCANKLSKAVQMEVKSRIDSLVSSSYGHHNNFKKDKLEFSSRICIFEKHFVVKEKNETTYPSSSRQKRIIEKEIKPAKLKKM